MFTGLGLVRSMRKATLLAILLTLPLVMFIPGDVAIVGVVEAAGCSVSSQDSTEWGTHIRNISIETTFMGEWNEWEDGERGFDNQDEAMVGITPYTGPLSPLRSGFHTSFSVGNGSGGGVRMNLTTGMRYTFCLTIDNANADSVREPPVDAYLFLTHDYDMYAMQYYLYGEEIQFMEDLEENIPPEWRGGLWRGFRDVHNYENIREAEFSVVLDKLETSTSLFSGEGTTYEEFIIFVDAINNTHIDDAPEPHSTSLVDLTVMVEEAFILPTWTVPLTCMALLLLLAAVPVIMHFKHSKAGLDGYKVDLVPNLEQQENSAEAGSIIADDVSKDPSFQG